MSLPGLPTLWLPVLRVRFSVPTGAFLALSFVRDIRGIAQGTPGVDWLAHIGGFLFGFFFAVALHLTRIEKVLINPGIEARVSFHQHPAVLKSFALRTKGRLESARRAIEAALVEQPQNVSVLREAYDTSVAAEASIGRGRTRRACSGCSRRGARRTT